MEKLFTLLVITLLSIMAFGQSADFIYFDYETVNSKNFELDSCYYRFIVNNNQYILKYPTNRERDAVGRISRISAELGLYTWINNDWVLASNDVISSDYRIFENATETHFDMIPKRGLHNFSKIQAFGDTIVMLITHQYRIEYQLLNKKSEDYLYNTINIFIPKGDGKYNIIKHVPENKKTKEPIWYLERGTDIIKSGNEFIFRFKSGTKTITI